MPWITQDIKRLIRKRDHLYRKFKKSGDQVFRDSFVNLRKQIKSKIKLAHMQYLEGLLGLKDENTTCDSKKLFAFLKSSKQDQLGSPPLRHNGKVVTDTLQKSNIQNSEFQSVFTAKSPLSLSRLCTMKLQDMTDSGQIASEAVPAGILNSTPVMEEFGISVAGILKLLKNLKPGKAAGPDRLRPLLLQELREEIASIYCKFSLSAHFKQVNFLWTGVEP